MIFIDSISKQKAEEGRKMVVGRNRNHRRGRLELKPGRLEQRTFQVEETTGPKGAEWQCDWEAADVSVWLRCRG